MLRNVRLATVVIVLASLAPRLALRGPRRGKDVVDRDRRRVHRRLRAAGEGVGDHLADGPPVEPDARRGALLELAARRKVADGADRSAASPVRQSLRMCAHASRSGSGT